MKNDEVSMFDGMPIKQEPAQIAKIIETTKLRKVYDRKKSEKYECTKCGGICYFPHGKSEIWYDFCPCCGRAVIRVDS